MPSLDDFPENLDYLQKYDFIDEYDLNQAVNTKLLILEYFMGKIGGGACLGLKEGVFYCLKFVRNDIKMWTWQYFLKNAIEGNFIKEGNSAWEEFDLEKISFVLNHLSSGEM